MLRRFSLRVVLRIVLILANTTVLAMIFGDKRLFFNQVILSILLIVLVWDLVRYVSRTNRELARFFYAVRHNDFSITFKSSGLGKSFRELDEAMMNIIRSYKKVKIEREAQFHFLQMLVDQLHTGIVAIEQDDIILINPTAEKLLGCEGVRSWRILAQQAPSFANEIDILGSDGRKLMEIKSTSEVKYISVHVRTLIILDRHSKLITLQDINSEIEQKEIEAWHKLIRILTHEIMNSVTPIASLTETLQGLLVDGSGNQKKLGELTEENILDIRSSLLTIHRRSEGLLRFVDNYRKLTKIPRPKFETVDVLDFLNSTVRLMAPELRKHAVEATVKGERAMLQLDPALVEQVIINLLTNSIQALAGMTGALIEINTYHSDLFVLVTVRDNGRGMTEKTLAQIFVPFFTTKKQGSGIGLSLSKQIMSLHGGTIRVTSQENSGTVFYLQFPLRRS